jgi:hypothetical protein
MSAAHPFLYVALAIYILVLALILYICFVADAETSRLALFFTEELPARTWRFVEKRVGRKTLGAIQYVADRALVMIYVVIVFGAWSVIFW